MAGPTAGVLLRRVLSPTELNEIHSTLRLIGDRFAVGHEGWELGVTDTRPIGGTYVGEARPFGFAADDIDIEPAGIAAIAAEFGFEPLERLGFWAGCNDREDHHILATLVLHFAKAHSGIIEFDGALMPRSHALRRFEALSWKQVQDEVSRWNSKLPGRLCAIPTDGETSGWHVADADFLAAWLDHPDFHMIK